MNVKAILICTLLISVAFSVFIIPMDQVTATSFSENINSLDWSIGDILLIHSTEFFGGWSSDSFCYTDENYGNIIIPLEEYWTEVLICSENSSEPLFIHANISGVMQGNASMVSTSYNASINNWAQLRYNQSFNSTQVISFVEDKLDQPYDTWSLIHTTKQINISSNATDGYGYYDTELVWAAYKEGSNIDFCTINASDNPEVVSWVVPDDFFNNSLLETVYLESESPVQSGSGTDEVLYVMNDDEPNTNSDAKVDSVFKVEYLKHWPSVMYIDDSSYSEDHGTVGLQLGIETNIYLNNTASWPNKDISIDNLPLYITIECVNTSQNIMIELEEEDLIYDYGFDKTEEYNWRFGDGYYPISVYGIMNVSVDSAFEDYHFNITAETMGNISFFSYDEFTVKY
jgi:uncharacterized protein YycO